MKNFGELVAGYQIPVFNEREVRASAGILFFFATLSFYNAFLIQNFVFLKIFVVFFFIEFCIRLFVSPRYAPAMILGRLIVQNQKPEYSGAPQKYFAWTLGLGMATIMIILLFVLDVRGIVNFIMCSICILLLFLETSFGICVGCKLYELITKQKPQLCPGNVCEVKRKEKIQEVSRGQIVILLIALSILVGVVFGVV
jgi:hypothetical protein